MTDFFSQLACTAKTPLHINLSLPNKEKTSQTTLPLHPNPSLPNNKALSDSLTTPHKSFSSKQQSPLRQPYHSTQILLFQTTKPSQTALPLHTNPSLPNNKALRQPYHSRHILLFQTTKPSQTALPLHTNPSLPNNKTLSDSLTTTHKSFSSKQQSPLRQPYHYTQILLFQTTKPSQIASALHANPSLPNNKALSDSLTTTHKSFSSKQQSPLRQPYHYTQILLFQTTKPSQTALPLHTNPSLPNNKALSDRLTSPRKSFSSKQQSPLRQPYLSTRIFFSKQLYS
ncbi:hypothetical protein CHS0354_025577 [Potamilus streckersoni]|uniref:Uncharacterized protein n=1 Tax=Potamilus streckersoni TaxID=2493646 RepID=A0AAE0S1E3_9BIVA|nr:hypothetical protein CHS0354_025577 [Potamilus streckersoni]